MRTFRVIPQLLLASAAIVGLLIGVSPAAAESAQEMQAAAERTMQELERVRDNPLALRDFLKRMPKGADSASIDPRHTGAWLDEVVGRAADQNEQYLPARETPERRGGGSAYAAPMRSS